MKLAGSYKLNVKKEIVWQALNDPNILKQCVPGCDSFEKETILHRRIRKTFERKNAKYRTSKALYGWINCINVLSFVNYVFRA